jgi:hypothetical protein
LFVLLVLVVALLDDDLVVVALTLKESINARSMGSATNNEVGVTADCTLLDDVIAVRVSSCKKSGPPNNNEEREVISITEAGTNSR